MAEGHLYFHSPCFDGIVAAVLALDYLEVKQGWRRSVLHGVNYDLRDKWLDLQLEQPAAVVDFLYHTDAMFWADHHPTTFLSAAARADYESRKNGLRIYRRDAKSCAGLLWDHLNGKLHHRNEKYEELVLWAEKTDSASYSSVQEAVFGDAPALRIAKGLALGDNGGYCAHLAHKLREFTLSQVAQLPEVDERYQQSIEQTRMGISRFQAPDAIHLSEEGVAVFDVDSRGVTINRYAPFLFFPQARYSLGIVRWEGGAKITAMRNPWMDFPSVPLDQLFARVGGGGHQRVGSVMLDQAHARDARQLRDRLLADITRAESAAAGGPAR